MRAILYNLFRSLISFEVMAVHGDEKKKKSPFFRGNPLILNDGIFPINGYLMGIIGYKWIFREALSHFLCISAMRIAFHFFIAWQ